jgi:protein-tyrosine-phosphatase
LFISEDVMKGTSILRILPIGLALAFGGESSSSQEAAQPTIQVLMVCEHGNVKSLMAASYFNELATARQLPFHAVARGTAPNSTTVPPPIVDGLRADGFDVSNFHPTAISEADVVKAERVILISSDLPSDISIGSKQSEKWTDVPPASANYDAARDALKAHIRALLDQMTGNLNRQ